MSRKGDQVIENKAMLRAADVARLLGVSRSRVYQLGRAGALPVVRQGRSVLIPRPAFEAWLGERSARALAGMRSNG